jgi:hypothetical protein
MKQFTALAVMITVLGLVLCMPGCGGSGKSSKADAGAGGSGSTGTGGVNTTGTGTSTGTGDPPPANVVKVNLGWAVGPNVEMSELEAHADKIRDANNELYLATDGNRCFGDQFLADDSDGSGMDILIGGAGIGSVGTTYHGMGPKGWQIGLRNPIVIHVFLHEWGHAMFGRQNEDYYCKVCSMAMYNPYNNRHYCDANDCNAGDPCWENYILKRYAGWSHTGQDPGPAPDCNIEIQDAP